MTKERCRMHICIQHPLYINYRSQIFLHTGTTVPIQSQPQQNPHKPGMTASLNKKKSSPHIFPLFYQKPNAFNKTIPPTISPQKKGLSFSFNNFDGELLIPHVRPHHFQRKKSCPTLHPNSTTLTISRSNFAQSWPRSQTSDSDVLSPILCLKLFPGKKSQHLHTFTKSRQRPFQPILMPLPFSETTEDYFWINFFRMLCNQKTMIQQYFQNRCN